MHRILFVSVAFPPKSDPEALQAAKYFYHLQNFEDLELDVVTSALPTLYMPYDADLEPYSKGVEQLISISLRENRYLNYFLTRLNLDKFFFPDIKKSFHEQSAIALQKLKKKPDLIYSRSEPKSSTIMAYKLKQALNVPWVLHMSDPWADCPIHGMKGMEYQRHSEWERRCFNAANIISLTSTQTIDFYKNKYPEFSDKFRFFPNVYDYAPENYDSNDETNRRKFRIVHTGGLTGSRSPEFFLKPLQKLYESNPEITERIEVIFAGATDFRNREIFRKYSLPFVNWIGSIPYREALRLQRSANYLLAIDNPIKDPLMSMFFPSKLLDYMLARKRILLITTKGSTSEEIVSDINGDICSHEDMDKIIRAVTTALRAYESGEREYLITKLPPIKYSAAHNASRLHEEFKKILNV